MPSARWSRLPALPAQGAPRILLDQPDRIVEYQLNRLTREQLVHVERRDDDRAVSAGVLSPAHARGSAAGVSATKRWLRSGRSAPRARRSVLLDALARVPADASGTGDPLIRMLVEQPVLELSRRRALFERVTGGTTVTPATGAAYAALLLVESGTRDVWAAAAGRDGHLIELLRGVAAMPVVPHVEPVRQRLVPLVGQLVSPVESAGTDVEIRRAALVALALVGRDAAAAEAALSHFRAEPRVADAAVRAWSVLPEAAWTPDLRAAVAAAVASWVRGLPPPERTSPAAADALALAASVAERIDGERGASLRREIRTAGVQVVRLTTLPEQVSFDLRWFVVEAGRPVQLVFANPDPMPHNVVVGRPGTLQEIGSAAAAMPMVADAGAKPFVPALPAVVVATRLLQQDEVERLAFVAPSEPGAYVFACTFPGHWTRMYGVMLVVRDVDAFEARPVAPTDPMTGQPMLSRRN